MANSALMATSQEPAVLNSEILRLSLRRVASTVNVIAVKCADGSFFATTATAVVAVCFTPPTALVCINRSSAIYEAIEREEIFSISVLGAAQEEIAGACAGGVPHHERESRFTQSDRVAGAATLAGTQATLVCRRSEVVVQGTHAVIFGTVIDASHQAAVDPLIYLDGGYGSFLRR